MRKTKLALTALMIGTLTVTGASFAEAKLKVDDVRIIVGARDDQRPPAPDGREAPRPPEAYRPDDHGGPRGPEQGHRGPAPRPVDDRGPRFDKPQGSNPHGHRGPGHDVPPPPPPDGPQRGGHR